MDRILFPSSEIFEIREVSRKRTGLLRWEKLDQVAGTSRACGKPINHRIERGKSEDAGVRGKTKTCQEKDSPIRRNLIPLRPCRGLRFSFSG